MRAFIVGLIALVLVCVGIMMLIYGITTSIDIEPRVPDEYQTKVVR